MRRARFPLLLPVVLAAGCILRGTVPVSAGDRFSPSCVLDLSGRLEAPAGSRGFLFPGSDGHFYFADGTRVRFWGINVAKDSLMLPREGVDRVVALFAEAGINLVRLHHFDEALLPADRAGQTERMDPQVLDRLDYWIHACKQRGIYLYLDLLDYRIFYEAEGVASADKLERAAKPVSVFNEKLIDLQMEYARELFGRHVNPYTGLRYADDPAIAILEICDENGLFVCRNRWGSMPSPYREELIRRWNFWLRSRYGTSAKLAEAWKRGLEGGLGAAERLEDGTVGLPGISQNLGNRPEREPDLRRFAAGVERDYLKQMVGFLRGIGVRIPITSVMDPDSPASLLAQADALDCIAANYYFGHPTYKTTYPPGVRFTYEAGDPLSGVGPDTAARRLTGPRVAGKPLVLREWNVCWPNAYRAEGLLEVAALAARQDLDAVILFGYYTTNTTTPISPFDVSQDPAGWGVTALAGEIYRDSGMRKGAPRVAVLWGSGELYNYASGALSGPIFDLGRLAVVQNWLPGHRGPRADHYAVVCDGGEGLLPGDAGKNQVVAANQQAAALAVLSKAVRAEMPDTGPVMYSDGNKLLRIEGLRVQALVGNLEKDRQSVSGKLRLSSASPHGALIWVSRDGIGPGDGGMWMAKMVTDAVNTGQQTRAHFRNGRVNLWALLEPGTGPVLSGGQRSEKPTVLTLGSQAVLKLWMKGGTWELTEADGRRRLYCDTPGVQFELPGATGGMLQGGAGISTAPLPGPPWVFPEGVEWVEALVG